MASGLVDIMKRAAMDAYGNQQPTDLRVGTVVSVKPLRVQVTAQLTIPESLLIVPENLTDYTVKVSFNWQSETVLPHNHSYSEGVTGDSGAHRHQIQSSGDKTITIHNALKIGDKVALIRKQGGQSYFILDRFKN